MCPPSGRLYLGQEGGAAAADVLFGDYNPAGRLPISVPRSVCQLPRLLLSEASGEAEYLGTTRRALFPFGYGLSYTSFQYSNVKVTPATIGPEGTAKVSVQ